MKIVHAIFSLTTGGAEHMLIDIVNEQAATADVQLFILNNEINDEVLGRLKPGVKYRTFNRRRGSMNPMPLALLNATLLAGAFDIIHCHNLRMVNMLLPALRNKAVLTIHDTINAPADFTRYDRCFAISQAVQDSVLVHADTYCRVVQNGVNFEEIQQRKQILHRTGNFRILQTSRLQHEKKGQHISIEALAVLRDRGITDVQLDLIGEGPSLEHLQKMAKERGVSDQVRFLGRRDRAYVYQNMQHYDLLVQPSIYEGFGLTVVEAMAARIPVLVSAIEGPMEILDFGKYGFLFEKESGMDMADKISHIMRIAPTAIMFSVDKAYNYARERFNIQKTALNYLKEYKQYA